MIRCTHVMQYLPANIRGLDAGGNTHAGIGRDREKCPTGRYRKVHCTWFKFRHDGTQKLAQERIIRNNYSAIY